MRLVRYGFKLAIRPGTEAEYDRRHQAVFPELLDVFRRAGIKTYSIFRDGTTLFAYMEVEDFDRAMALIEQSEANRRWQTYMQDLLIPVESGHMSWPLPEVFHFSS